MRLRALSSFLRSAARSSSFAPGPISNRISRVGTQPAVKLALSVSHDASTRPTSLPAGADPRDSVRVGPGANDEDRAALRLKLDGARKRITSGESFSSVARSVSEGQTAVQGGELGCVGPSYGVGSEELLKAAAALKPGELSGMV